MASTFYTGALQTVTYDIPRYRFRGCRVFTNKPPCGPKRGHGTPQSRFGQEVQLDKIAEHLAIDPAELRLRHRRAAGHADRQLPARRHDRTRRVHSTRRRAIGLEREVPQAAARPRVGLACSSYLSGAGLPINWNDLPHSGVQLKLDRSGGVTCSAAPPRSARARTTCWWRWWRRSSASIRSTCARSPATPISRRSISVRTRAASR